MLKFNFVFILYLYLSSIGAHDENYRVLSSKREIDLYQDNGYFPDQQYPEECLTILNTFAQYASNFTFCSLKNAKPITLCTNCVNDYLKFSEKYQELLNTIVNGTSCGSLFISQDRFDVVLEYYDWITDIWNKGHCSDCFDFTGGTARLSNNTLKFNKMCKETMECINKTNIDPNNLNNTDEICVRCMKSYLELDKFYKTLSKDSIGVETICMDTFDSMNRTRSIWSKTLNCCKLRKTPEIIFLCCTAIISLLPLLFYMAVRYYVPIRDLTNVFKESRFKQSIMRSDQGRIN